MIEITDDTLDKTVQQPGLTLVKLTASWCSPCRQYNPVLEKFSEETGTVVYSLDIDHNPETPVKYTVLSIPTTLVYYNGEYQKQFTGAKPTGALKKELAPWLSV